MKELKRYHAWAKLQGSQFSFAIVVIKCYSMEEAIVKLAAYELDSSIMLSDISFNTI